MAERRRLAPRTGVLVLVAVMLAVTATLWYAASSRGSGAVATPRLPWWLLAPLFAVVEVVVLHVQVRREAQTISLNEIPLCLALFLASPPDMLLAATLGSAGVYLLYRRQTAIKALFNSTLRAFGVTLTLTLAHLLDATLVPESPRAWLAASTAAAVAGAADGLVVLVVVGIHDGTVHPSDVLRELLRYSPISAVVASVGVLAAITLHADPRTAPVLVVVAVALFAGYRAHAALNDQHVSLSRLYDVGRSVTATHHHETIVAGVLTGARDLLRAEAAEIVLLAGEQQEPIHRWISSGDSMRLRREDLPSEEHPASWPPVVAGGTALLLPRGLRADRAAEELRSLGYREAIVVPLKADSAVIGTLMVADRMGEVRTFHAEDIPALETIANQAALALANARLLERLRHEAMHDVLTGLPNRAMFRTAVDAALTDLSAAAGGICDPFAVLLLDLNGFKDVNDSLGHQAGDRLLVHVADCLSEALQPPALAARLGGDEFAVLLPASGRTGAEAAAESIHKALARPLTIDGIDVQIRSSTGIAFAPDHGRTTTDLLRAADTAMYAAKTSKGRTRIYSSAPGETEKEEFRTTSLADTVLARVAELRRAVTDREITIDVQPQARADTGDVIGVEALIRWHHPRHGAVPPADLLRLADRHGLMHDLTELVLDAAVSAAAAWRSMGLDLTVAVNVAVPSLLDPRLGATVASALRRHALPPSRLTLELTEESMMNDPQRTVAVLTALRDTGVRLSVDDFGTGYSSLSYLRRLPVHEVKIDRSFMSSLAIDTADLAITRSIIDLGANLSLDVVAEGVEDQETWDRLVSLGCHAIQGNHLARPMPVQNVPDWLRGYSERQGQGPRIGRQRRDRGLSTATMGEA
jgi:diguanylate cyclase (GGDEF)-like protein